MALVFDFDSIPSRRVLELVRWCAHSKRVPLQQISREDAKAFYQDIPHRMTPWGVQYRVIQGDKSDMWVPPIPFAHHLAECRQICGAWIRDCPFFDSHRTQNFESVERSKALLAFKHDEVTDSALDLAFPLAVEPQPPLTTTSKFTELPTEITQLILSHLLPSGCIFQFFSAREAGSSVNVPCVQKFVLEQDSDKSRSHHNWDECPCRTKRDPYTASTYLAVAATCRYLQNEAYARFYSQNTFIFHLSTCAIRSEVQISSSKQIRAWSRALPRHNSKWHNDAGTGLGPMSALAISYLRKVMLISSIPPSPTTKNFAALKALVGRASTSLCHAELKSLTIDYQQPLGSTSTDIRSAPTILTIETLEATVRKGNALAVAPRDQNVVSLKGADRTQQVLEPLLGVNGSFPKVEELVLGGLMREILGI